MAENGADDVDKKYSAEYYEQLSNERIEKSRKALARVLCRIEGIRTDVSSACELMKWNDDVVYLIDEAATKLGYALATLDTWDDALGNDD